MITPIQKDIRIGTLAGCGPKTAEYIAAILPHGFESFELNCWQELGETDLRKLSRQIKDVLAGSDAVISSLGIYGNPLDPASPKRAATLKSWKAAIDAAPLFGCDLVCGFAGRVVGQPVPASIPRFQEVFGPLLERAAKRGVPVPSVTVPFFGSPVLLGP